MNDKKVLLGMSGGIDSSVAAILLQSSGYEVTGITFRFFEVDDLQEYLHDAKDLATRLNIEHIIFDARDLFYEKIIRYFIREYLSGKTPVPCAICNVELKWKLLSQIGDKLGISQIATGHYVKKECINDKNYIVCGNDREKDQSFFLWGLNQQILKKAIFPLGSFTKEQVRDVACKQGFTQMIKKKESTGTCFCPKDYRLFLNNHLPEDEKIVPGFFEDEHGKILGKHKGYPFYTIGQRRGLGINLQKPVFVKNIYPETNRIVLSDLKSLEKNAFFIKNYHVICPSDFNHPVICKIRYRKQATQAQVIFSSNKLAYVKLFEPVTAIAPGQSAVFYEGNRVLGGGIIV